MTEDRNMTPDTNAPNGLPDDHDPQSDHWLVRPSSIRLLWIVFAVILALTVVPDFWIHQYDHFGIEGTFGFYAWFGFLSCVAMVIGAKMLSIFLKRPDTYYDDPAEGGDDVA